MRALVLMVLTAGMLVADEPQDAVKKQLKAIEGSWTATSILYNGKEFIGDKLKLRFVFKGDQATVEGDDAVKKEYAKLGVKLDPSTTPMCVDFKVSAGVQKDATMEGVYELKDDELKFCIKVLGNERPSKFESPAGSSIALVVLKKDKP